jgi:hypothetical protein
MSTTTPITLDAALKAAIEGRDAAALLDLYADDAEVEIADAEHPPSAPRRISGKEALRALFEDVYGRDMTHAVGPVAVGPDRLGYLVRCAYADGTRVLCAAAATLRGGRIVRETAVQAWDG